jgi:hypothetical protein
LRPALVRRIAAATLGRRRRFARRPPASRGPQRFLADPRRQTSAIAPGIAPPSSQRTRRLSRHDVRDVFVTLKLKGLSEGVNLRDVRRGQCGRSSTSRWDLLEPDRPLVGPELSTPTVGTFRAPVPIQGVTTSRSARQPWRSIRRSTALGNIGPVARRQPSQGRGQRAEASEVALGPSRTRGEDDAPYADRTVLVP